MRNFSRVTASLEWNSESELVLYAIPTNDTGIRLRASINQTLDLIVRSWIEHGDDFMMEEAENSEHGKQGVVNEQQGHSIVRCQLCYIS